MNSTHQDPWQLFAKAINAMAPIAGIAYDPTHPDNARAIAMLRGVHGTARLYLDYASDLATKHGEEQRRRAAEAQSKDEPPFPMVGA